MRIGCRGHHNSVGFVVELVGDAILNCCDDFINFLSLVFMFFVHMVLGTGKLEDLVVYEEKPEEEK